jgi:hypothetical protein
MLSSMSTSGPSASRTSHSPEATHRRERARDDRELARIAAEVLAQPPADRRLGLGRVFQRPFVELLER